METTDGVGRGGVQRATENSLFRLRERKACFYKVQTAQTRSFMTKQTLFIVRSRTPKWINYIWIRPQRAPFKWPLTGDSSCGAYWHKTSTQHAQCSAESREQVHCVCAIYSHCWTSQTLTVAVKQKGLHEGGCQINKSHCHVSPYRSALFCSTWAAARTKFTDTE